MITIENLTKSFKVYRRRRGMVMDLFGLAKEGADYDWVHSLKGLSLTVPKGHVHGIVGMNGAGKSTLLKILSRVLDPTSGSFSIHGRVATLLELGTGFHSELTGRENVKLNATMAGFAEAEVAQKIEKIEAFSELKDFFDRPIKIYSSGMYVRLAFAFAIAIDPDVLIIDEALSVGDIYFQQKCLKKIMEYKERGTTILFVSHDLGAVRRLCDHVTLLSEGEALYTGDVFRALDLYNIVFSENHNLERVRERVKDVDDRSELTSMLESGSGEMKVLSTQIFAKEEQEGCVFESGSTVTVLVRAQVFASALVNPTCGILIRDRLGSDVFGTNSHCLGVDIGRVHKGEIVDFSFEVDLNLGSGDFTLTVGLHADKTHSDGSYHWVDRALIFKVIPGPEPESVGPAWLPVRLSTLLSS